MSSVVTKIDFSPKIIKEEFPNIVIADANDTTPLVAGLLEKGTMALICAVDKKRKVVGHISESAYNIDRILRTHGDVTLNQSVSNRVRIHSVREYMEVMDWTS